MQNLYSVLAELKKQHYAYYLYAMLAPKASRESVVALLTFESELAQIPHKVSEPMLGDIRFAWWRETLEILETGTCTRAHPAIDAIKNVLPQNQSLLAILNQRLVLHQQHYDLGAEHQCTHVEDSLISTLFEIIKQQSDAAAQKWQKKAQVIHERNAQKSVTARDVRLLLKLFVA